MWSIEDLRLFYVICGVLCYCTAHGQLQFGLWTPARPTSLLAWQMSVPSVEWFVEHLFHCDAHQAVQLTVQDLLHTVLFKHVNNCLARRPGWYVGRALSFGSKGPGFKSRQGRLSPLSILVDKMSSTTCRGNRESLLRLIHPTEMYAISSCTPWLKDIAKLKEMSSSRLWLLALCSINPWAYVTGGHWWEEKSCWVATTTMVSRMPALSRNGRQCLLFCNDKC